jgi:nitrite reductase (NO-forming)
VEDYVTRRTLTVALAALALAPGLALVAAPAGIAQDASPEASPEASPGATPGATPTAGNEVTITSHDIFFEPKEVTIPADTEVTIKLPNEGVTLHSFLITDHKNENLPFDPIDIDIDPGATEEVTINAPAGSYYFFCNIPGHEAAGMFGTLTVE